MSVRPVAALREIRPYKPGESAISGVAAPAKLSSNENPLGCSAAALAAIRSLADLQLYPEGTSRVVREAVAARYGLDPNRIVCGAGSDEIIAMLARAYLEPGCDVVQTQYAFSMYKIASAAAGASIVTAADRDCVAQVDAILEAITPNTKIVWLANPNNPTGTYVPVQEVRRLHAALRRDILLVIDAAYAEYVRANDYAAGIELAADHENVVMTRTFSKIHGLAALRIGWAYAAPDIIENLEKVRGPFNVSTPAQAAAAAALADEEFVARSVAHNSKELTRVADGLLALGLEVTPSVANFLLVHFGSGEARARADAALRAKGLIVRDVQSYGLPAALRVTIGLEEQNDLVLSTLREWKAQEAHV